ncbi:hypothetical protein N9850_09060 [Granulosicoccus sp.]|nr:hypothetical protein [Granulosicoccus sp.]MDB4223909.1 hypothetical protein [Granulosicoccus sp.]
MKILLILSLFLLSQPGQTQDDGNNSSQNRSNCQTHTVINETTKTSSTITRCLNETVVDLQHEEPKTEESSTQANENLEHHGFPFNAFSDLNAQISMAESTDAIRTYTFIPFFEDKDLKAYTQLVESKKTLKLAFKNLDDSIVIDLTELGKARNAMDKCLAEIK